MLCSIDGTFVCGAQPSRKSHQEAEPNPPASREADWEGLETDGESLEPVDRVLNTSMLRRQTGRGRNRTVKLLLTFLVLDSATLASVRSTSSKMMDCRQTTQR